jgi:Zn finger protein HypA/HybF involved in hydrogenase expression
MFDRIGEAVAAHHAMSVHRVRVRIGEWSGVEPALLQTAYEVFRVNTWCADAPLVIQEVRASDDLVLDQLELEVP